MEPGSDPTPTLHARDEGTGPPILLLHGLGADHTIWNAQIGPLAEEFRVLAPDLRGHGRSPLPPWSTFSVPELVGDLTALLDARGVPSAHVIGLSAGGFLALGWAAMDPRRVRSLVLSGSSTHCDAHTRSVAKNWADTYRTQGVSAYTLRLVKDLYAPEWTESHMEIVEQLERETAGRDLAGAILWGRALQTFDLRGRLSKMTVPTLILHGMDDRVVDPSHARLLRQTISGAQVRLFALTGHMVPVERPQETTDAIRSWVRASEAARPTVA